MLLLYHKCAPGKSFRSSLFRLSVCLSGRDFLLLLQKEAKQGKREPGFPLCNPLWRLAVLDTNDVNIVRTAHRCAPKVATGVSAPSPLPPLPCPLSPAPSPAIGGGDVYPNPCLPSLSSRQLLSALSSANLPSVASPQVIFPRRNAISFSV